MVQRDKKRSLLFINQYYYPDKASTGQLLTELCEALSSNFDVTAIVGTPSYSPSLSTAGSNEETLNRSNVRILRVFNTTFNKNKIIGRLVNYLSFMVFASLKALLTKKHDIVITMSDPPTVNFTGYLVKKFKGSKLVQICQDVFPEIAISLGHADNPLMIKMFGKMNSLAQGSCDRLVAISDGMKKRLAKKGIREEKISVIENWVDCEKITPEGRINPFSRKYALENKFTVMHSGNIGLSQNLDLLLDTACELKAEQDIAFVFIGDGAERGRLLEKATQAGLSNVQFLPYQEKEDLKYSLSSGDVHFVSLKKGLSGLIVPSKIYGIMAAGRPIISCLEEGDDVNRFIAEEKCGTNIVDSDPVAVAKEILYFYGNRGLIDEYGRRGREAVVKRNAKTAIVNQYLVLLNKII